MRATRPAQRLAHHAHDLFHGVGNLVIFGEHPRDAVLDDQAAFHLDHRGNIPGDAAIAGAAPRRIEYRLAATVDVAHRAAPVDDLKDKVGKGLSACKHGFVPIPAQIVDRKRVMVPERGTEKLLRIDTLFFQHTSRQFGEAEAFILLPIPIVGEFVENG